MAVCYDMPAEWGGIIVLPTMKANDLAELVKQKIENLRPKLLDLSRRNPLIATKLGPRSSSHIRAVDELPDVLFFKLNNGQAMRLVPLPAIDDEPKDEEVSAFREALINARLTDQQYLAEMEAVERDTDDYIDRTRRIERDLKDRVRAAFGLPPRTNKSEVNLIHHAKINGITPSYELPTPDAEHVDGRHSDDDIQTLLLPNDLERKLNAIISKCRTWVQETGMNVLHIAYGFLEWSDGIQTETSFAPLVLCETQIDKRRTSQGVEFAIRGNGEDAQVNAVLAEKLRLEFGVELPEFAGSSVEKYLSEVSNLSPRNMVWRVRRQVAIGVFPSARMSMYHDLNPSQPDFPESDIVDCLLGGTNTDSLSPFADEYEVDVPEIENKVPCLVMDADSSQFSTLVDLAEGKNLAVEGPPGTGKSQTIVNAIAAALAEGKKVLFVAEKLAALNVVKSRLEMAGLGEFLLPLQADRATREQVVDSIRQRVEMHGGAAVRDFDNKLKEYRRVRQDLARYIELLIQPFGDSGLTIGQILGKSIATNPCLSIFSPSVLETCKVPQSFLTISGLTSLRQAGTRVENANREAAVAKEYWRATKLVHPERFTVEQACDLARNTSDAFSLLAGARERLNDDSLAVEIPTRELLEIDSHLKEAQQHLRTCPRNVLLNLLRGNNAQLGNRFLERCQAHRLQLEELTRYLAMQPSVQCLELMEKTKQLCERLDISTLNPDDLAEDMQGRRDFVDKARSILAMLAPLVDARPDSSGWALSDIAKAHCLLKECGREALLTRNSGLDGPSAIHFLKKLCSEGKLLRAEKAEIAHKISISVEVSLETLVDCVSTLRVAGPFRVLSSRYRAAKRMFLSFSLLGKFDKAEAITTLDSLIAFRRKEAEFTANAHAISAFGAHFRGIETDFDLFERLARFSESVDASFGQARKREIRTFLREADVNELDLVPPLPEVDVPITYNSIKEKIEAAEAEISKLKGAILELASCVHVFSDPKLVEPNDLNRLIGLARLALEEGLALDRYDHARSIFEQLFEGARTKNDPLHLAARWAATAQDFSKIISIALSKDRLDDARMGISAVVTAERRADETLAELANTAKIDSIHFTEGLSFRQVAHRLNEAAKDVDGLFTHALLETALEDIRSQGLFPLVAERLTRGPSLQGLGDQLEAIGVRQLARAVYAAVGPELTKFRGSTLDELRKRLAEQDREIIRLSRSQLRTKVYATARPPRGNGFGRKSTWTEMALIENEISKTQRFISVRDLTKRAGRALLQLKPCWMMSPLAVAQYVPKGAVHFDLCIIDEASQMPPESAIGALLRCSQTMVVGDTNQLPPSSFFRTLINDEDADEDESVLDESILEMANATFRPSRRLRWHYRSRHSGLIKFSNRLVYDDHLIVFPSATESLSRMGVEFRPITGRYKAGTNPTEAKAIVEAALQFMRADPNRSLGIVTLNQKQRDLINEEFEYALGGNAHAVKYMETWKAKRDGLEEFFIKNLENVQGDERDVIFIGTVYGPEELDGKVMQRFGPINGLAGKRRLNVLFTRAKEKIVTFSSMTASDIVADEHTNPGAYLLKRWIEYSAGGLLEGGQRTRREPDSEFEIFVMNQIRSIGCEPEPQVGVAGYFIDIGIRHPEWPHGFVLGVECDGASYHSAKSARDRDRLRQEILEGLGWQLHRVWSTDWFNNPQREAERLRTIISTRLKELKRREFEYCTTTPTPAPQPPSAAPQEAIVLPLRSQQKQRPIGGVDASQFRRPGSEAGSIAVGDTVRIRYLSDDRKTLQITISRAKSDPSQGIIHHEAPLAKALLGAEEGDEMEVLVGSYVRPAVVECITKGFN